MVRLEIGFGIQFDRDNQQIPPEKVEDGIRTVLFKAAEIWDGGNCVRGFGFWRNPAGQLVVEESCTLVVDVESLHTADVTAIVMIIKRELRQASVHVVEIPLAYQENI